MKRPTHLTGLSLLLVMVGAGCGTQDAEIETEEMVGQVDFVAFREEVNSALNNIQSEISQLQGRVEPQAEEEWTNLTTNTQEAAAEMMAEMDRLSTATAEEAREIQQAAAERLAELEAEVSKSEISSATTADSLVATVNMQLTSLESDIRTLAEEIANTPAETPEVGSMGMDGDDPLVLQERLAEIRTELAEITTAPSADGFEDSREELGSDIAQLTEDVRKRWYEQQWGLEG